MPDIADDRAAFREALARAEEASGITRDDEGNEVYADGETPVATTELTEAVPVQASDQQLTPEPAQEADTSEQQEEVPVAAVPTLKELQAKLEAAEARLAEKDSMIGRQSTEVGDLRKQIEEIQTRINSTPATPVTPALAITQELIDSDPAAAVQAAFAQGNEQALKIAFNAWKDPMNPVGDPFAAAAWLNDRKLEQQQQAFEAKLAEAQAKIEALNEPIAETQETKAWTAAFDQVRSTHADFLEHAERLLTEVAPKYPALTTALQSGDATAKAEALSALYALDKVGNPEAFKAQIEEATREAEAEAAAARVAAGVVAGQTTAGQPSEEKTEAELEQEAYVARMGRKPSLSRGWTGRS